jgi:hypothetical protein
MAAGYFLAVCFLPAKAQNKAGPRYAPKSDKNSPQSAMRFSGNAFIAIVKNKPCRAILKKCPGKTNLCAVFRQAAFGLFRRPGLVSLYCRPSGIFSKLFAQPHIGFFQIA